MRSSAKLYIAFCVLDPRGTPALTEHDLDVTLHRKKINFSLFPLIRLFSYITVACLTEFFWYFYKFTTASQR